MVRRVVEKVGDRIAFPIELGSGLRYHSKVQEFTLTRQMLWLTTQLDQFVTAERTKALEQIPFKLALKEPTIGCELTGSLRERVGMSLRGLTRQFPGAPSTNYPIP